MNHNWYAIHSLFNREIIAAQSIEKARIESFLPMVQERRADGVGKYKRVTLPLFPRYLFIYAEPESLPVVRRLQGVAYVVSDGDNAATVPEYAIEEIKSRIVNGYVKLDEKAIDCPFNVGDDVVINTGFAAGFSGVFKQWIPVKQRVGILLNIMGREQIVHLDLSDVSPMARYAEL